MGGGTGGFWEGRGDAQLTGWLADLHWLVLRRLLASSPSYRVAGLPARLPGCRMAVEKLKEGIHNFAGG